MNPGLRRVAPSVQLAATRCWARVWAACLVAPALSAPLPPIVGDGMPLALTATPGDAVRGRALVADRRVGLCLLCHSAPIAEERFQGNLAPSLAGAGSRWSLAQLRLRLVDNRYLNPDSLMPAFHRSQDLQRVGQAWRDQPVLDAQQIEDVLAYLQGLR